VGVAFASGSRRRQLPAIVQRPDWMVAFRGQIADFCSANEQKKPILSGDSIERPQSDW